MEPVDMSEAFRKTGEATRKRHERIRQEAINSLESGEQPVAPEVLRTFALGLAESNEHKEFYQRGMARVARQIGDQKLISGVETIIEVLSRDGEMWSTACELRPDVFSAEFVQAIKGYEKSGELSKHLKIYVKYLDERLSSPKGIYNSSYTPPEIQESLRVFRQDHPDPARVGFIMMRFGNTSAHERIIEGIRLAFAPSGLEAVRADERDYHTDLLFNIQTCMHGCGFGVAVFERIEEESFNPNVSFEVGYMMAMRKPVCLLKDRTLKTLHADLAGKLYKVFDSQDPVASIQTALSLWLVDKRLGYR